jgi:hypothetical protein
MKRLAIALSATVGALGWAACGAGDARIDDDDATGPSGTGGETTSTGDGGLNLGGNNVGGGSGGGLGCSADLQYVVDGNGVVVQDCWPDAGCAEGMCVPPCEAAAKSQGNVGCEFVVATPHFYDGIAPPCFSAFVANNWPKAATLTVEHDGQSYDATLFGRIPDAGPTATNWQPVPATGVPAGEVAVLFLSHDPSSTNLTPLTCPVSPAISQQNGTAQRNSGPGKAWKITSSIPVSAYDILPFGGATSYLPSAELIMPTSAWGLNYIAVTPKPSSGPPWGQIVAAENGTTITILPTINLPAAGPVPAAPANQATTFTLSAGDYIQWELGSGQDMSGTVIQADKPISFTGGDAYICYSSSTTSQGGCDSAHQMIPPIRAWGSEYVGPPYANRGATNEAIPYRIVGAADGTVLAYDPPLGGAPTTLSAGQVAMFEAIGPFTVRSQDEDHPIYIGQLMTGCTGNGGGAWGCLGDEEYVNVLPPAQFLKKYVFFTDPSYPTTNLVVTRVKGSDNAFKDVVIDCLGAISGWAPVGSDGRYEITNVDLVRLGQSNVGCTNGPHVAHSDGQFGIMVWGLDGYSSYAYPAGGSVATINDLVVPPVPE